MQRFHGYCSGHFGILHKDDAFVRLPCVEEMYENQEESRTPYFDNGIVDNELSNPQDQSCMGSMAYLVQIACIWDDILAYIYRSTHRSRESYRTEHDRFHCKAYARLESWCSSLPSHLVFSRANLAINLRDGNLGTFISLHSLFHMCFMTLNRHIRHEDLSIDSIRRSSNEAICHALQLLHMMEILSKSTCKTPKPSTSQSARQRHFHQHQFPTFSTPFPGYAILLAIDTVSATGSLERELFTETFRVMNEGLKIVIQLSRFWSSARNQRKAIMRRIEDISNAVIDYGTGSSMKAWVVESPMIKAIGPEEDVFYMRDWREMRGEENRVRLLGVSDMEVEENEVVFVTRDEESGSGSESERRSSGDEYSGLEDDDDDCY